MKLSKSGQFLLNRRNFLSNTVSGLAGISIAHLLTGQNLLADQKIPVIDPSKPYAARLGHQKAKAKNVIMIYCSGACSQIDTFDYKPELIKHHGKDMPGGKDLVTFQGRQGKLNKSPWEFRPRGKCGKMISDLVPNIGDMADDICFLHSLTSKTNTHGPGENFMSTGNTLDGYPSVGAWATYALGSEADDLPAYVAIPDPRGTPQSSVNNWGPGYLPAAFQGTAFNAENEIRNLRRPTGLTYREDKETANFLREINEINLEKRFGDSDLAARISSYELAAKMQLSVPDVSDISSEPKHILNMYGADSNDKLKAAFAKNCILGRKLIEKGVRFVQLFNGAYQTGGEGVSNWDGHKSLEPQYKKHGRVLDQPTAALLKDLKQRGLLENTLVVWCTEFGRMPTFQAGASGRDHNPQGFTCWLAGAGIKAPYTFGATDEFGYKAVEDVLSVHDFHATILHLLGIQHEKLTYYYNGFEQRLTSVHGHVIKEILA